IKIKMEDIMIKHGYNVQLPEDNEEFSEAFNQWNDEIVNIINSAKENIIDNNPSDYPCPDSTKVRYDKLCEDAFNKLMLDLRVLNYGGIYQISRFDNKCGAKEVTVKTPIPKATIPAPDFLSHVGTTTNIARETTGSNDLADALVSQTTTMPQVITEEQTTDKTTAVLSTPATTENTESGDLHRSLTTKLNSLLLAADEKIEIEMHEVRANLNRYEDYLETDKDNSQYYNVEDLHRNASYEYYSKVVDEIRDAINKLRTSEKQDIDNMAVSTNNPADSGSASVSPKVIETYKSLEDSLIDETIKYYSDVVDQIWDAVKILRTLEKQDIDNMTVSTNNPADSGSASVSPKVIETYKSEQDSLIDEAITSLNEKVEAGYGEQDMERYKNVYTRIQNWMTSNKLMAPAPLMPADQPYIEHSAATSGASRPSNILSDVASLTSGLLARVFTAQPLVDTYHLITGTEQESTSLPYQKQSGVAAEPRRSIKDLVYDTEPFRQAPKAPHIHPGLVNMRGALQPEKVSMIGAVQNISINNMDSSNFQLASLFAAKITGQKLSTSPSPRFSPPDTKSAIHNNPASNMLSNTVTVMTVFLLSKMLKDLISPRQQQSLDASWTPESILDLAILQESCPRQGQPTALPAGLINDVFNSPVVGIKSGSDNFGMNRDGELTIREGKPEREYQSLLLHSLAKDCRNSSTPIASTENAQNDVSDKALAEQIHKQLPGASPEDRAIIYRAMTLKAQQKTTWTGFFSGSSWPTDRNEQIEKMYDLLNSVTKSQGQKSAPKTKSQGQKSISVVRQVMKAVKDGNLQQGETLFMKLPIVQILKLLDGQMNKQDICQFDQSENLYREVTKGFTELCPDESRDEHRLQEANKFRHSTRIHQSLGKLRDGLNVQHDVKEAQLKQKAFQLLVYQYDIKIAVKPELKLAVELQHRIINEKWADSLGEAKVLSQIIPEMLGPRIYTRYEVSQRQDGLKLKVPYQLLKRSGPEVDEKLNQFRNIKEKCRLLYLGIFDKGTDLEKEIISSVSLKFLHTSHGKELSEEKQARIIRQLLEEESRKS
ncbi:hypothetical protein, partial [Endozoicomonas sp.]|uniref:hypothetical protein n=1 Tax=Endozoicomonas sp. TaxID=1892382 RepID=UPI00383AD7E3